MKPNYSALYVRKGVGMTQEQFAEFFALDVATVRNWEQGRSSVDRAAPVLIKAIRRSKVSRTRWVSA